MTKDELIKLIDDVLGEKLSVIWQQQTENQQKWIEKILVDQKRQEQKAEKAKAEENKKDESEKDEPEEGKEAQASQQQEAKIGEMSKEDALRLLSTLPEENKEALKEALKRQHGGQRGTGKDW